MKRIKDKSFVRQQRRRGEYIPSNPALAEIAGVGVCMPEEEAGKESKHNGKGGTIDNAIAGLNYRDITGGKILK